MAQDTDALHDDFLELTASIVSAYVAANALAAADLPDLIARVDGSLRSLGTPAAVEPVAPIAAVPVRRSVMPDYIVCLEDGKKFKSLKRHLRTAFGMSPDQYRAKWNLPRDYPMVAPNYAAARSQIAKSAGLGQIRRVAKAAAQPASAKRSKALQRKKI